MKVFYISTYANPKIKNGNTTSSTLASKLIELNIDVNIVTCSADPTWHESLSGEVFNLDGFDVLKTSANGIPIISVGVPDAWYQHTLDESTWEHAVSWGILFFRKFNPNIVHLQQWQNLWWLLEAAQRLNIPTVYSVNDYGMTCQRIVLIDGEGNPCNGEVSIKKCSKCVFKGRSIAGKINEIVVALPGGQPILEFISRAHKFSNITSRSVNLPVKRRVELRIERSRSILSKLSACIVGSPFGAEVMIKNGLRENAIEISPWFHTEKDDKLPITVEPTKLILGFIGRISPEKGLHILLDAVSRIDQQHELHLKIAGEVSGHYAKQLYERYKKKVGHATIEWLGWLSPDERADFYLGIHMLVVPSLCLETGPLSLVEALAFKKPVLCTDVPPMKWLIDTFQGGIVFPFADTEKLMKVLQQLIDGDLKLTELSRKIINPPNLETYSKRVVDAYHAIS